MAEGMGLQSVFIYSDEFAQYEYSPSHPFKPIRAKLTYELCRRYNLLDRPWIKIIKPEPLRLNQITVFHDEEYIRTLAIASLGGLTPEMMEYGLNPGEHPYLPVGPEILKFGLGTEENPIFIGMYDYAALTAGATHLGAELLVEGEVNVAFNPLGGFHHAARDHAEGFCYINDVAVTICHLLKMDFRVAFIDIDAHHSNGVQDAFYEDDRVLTISLHESGKTLYPWSGFENEIGKGKGRGFNVNIPLAADSDDEVFVFAFKEIVPPLVKAFNPSLIIAELGADTHVSDPLAHLSMTNNGFCEAVKMIKNLSPRILAVGGGGYDLYKTARSWSLAWSILNELEPKDEFLGTVGGMMFGPELDVGSLKDKTLSSTGAAKEKAWGEAERIVNYIKKVVFPVHGIR
jgi:acetoin utilization protein AcuC